MKAHKLEVDTLVVDSFSTDQADPISLQGPALLIAYGRSFGWDCVSCDPACARWVEV